MTCTGLVLGIDIGGTNTKFGYVDREGNCLAHGVVPTRSEVPPTVFFQHLHAETERLRSGLEPGHRLLGIGVGAPNANYYKGTIEHPPNLRWDWVDLRAELALWSGLPMAATNDANAAALGEMRFGAARGMRDFIAITLGTGLGSGIVVNGELVYGASGFAGELGHIEVDPEGRPCGCGRRGCLEAYVSATGLRLTALELLSRSGLPSRLREPAPAELNAQCIAEAARLGDALAQEAFETTGRLLGRKLTDAVAFTSPEAIFLLGGLAEAGDLIFAPARRALEDRLLDVYRGTVRLLPSGVASGKAAVLGAAALMWTELAAQ
ncbi:MAG TPA: ROK family protein [Holophaga sp.]|nr:ROK family protein [Holophaga sp.]